MNKREINRAIRLTGIKPVGYIVRHDIPGEELSFQVPNVGIGNTIVRALRDRAGRVWDVDLLRWQAVTDLQVRAQRT